MPRSSFSRRDFLKLSALSFGLFSLSPTPNLFSKKIQTKIVLVGRKEGVSVHKLPSDESIIMYQRNFNDIINVYYDVISDDGPAWNPLWYRVWGGYLHSGNVTEVKHLLNPVQTDVKENGQIAEVTVPYTRSWFFNKSQGWSPKYRLHYGSIHWVMDVIEGPENKPWYKIKDELSSVELGVPAEHLRYIEDIELSPISTDVPEGKKRIEVSLAYQTLKAYEGDTVVRDIKISSGIPVKPTQTPVGSFRIRTKMPSKHMGDGNLTDDIFAYELMGVPWNCFFQMEDGIATHGTYWHTNFGMPMSKGCINLSIDEAKWIYRWTYPIATSDDWAKHGFGTAITIT